MHKSTLAILLLYSLCFSAFTQKEKYNQLSSDDGIISNHIDDVLIDHFGFLWMASYDGVQKWDGIKGELFVHHNSDSNSINSNICNVLFEDTQFNVWLGTLKGLNKYNRKTGLIERINLPVNDIPVNAIKNISDSILWIGTSDGLFAINVLTNHVFSPVKKLVSFPIFALEKDKDNCIYVGTFSNGIYRIDSVKNVIHLNKKNLDIPTKIRCLNIDSKNRLWVGSFNEGVQVLKNTGETIFNHQFLLRKQLKEVTNEEIRCIYEDKNGRIWIGILDQKLQLFDEKNQVLLPQTIFSRESETIGAEGIFAIAEDQFGNRWLASHGMGMFYTNRYKNVITDIKTPSIAGNKAGNNIITSVVEDKEGNLYGGTSGGGILHKNPSGKLSMITSKEGLSSNSIQGLAVDENNNLWIATAGGGVQSYHPKSQKISSLLELKYQHIKSVEVVKNELLIGTHGNGVILYDLLAKKIKRPLTSNDVYSQLQHTEWVNHVTKDNKNRIWVSTCFGVFIAENNQVIHCLKEQQEGLQDDYVNMTAQDSNGVVYLISESGGLQYYNETNKSFENLKKKELPACVKSIVVDQSNQIWLGTNEGIFCISSSRKEVKKLSKENGLLSNHFFHKAVAVSNDGALYFGSLKGINSFHPLALNRPDFKLSLHFQQLKMLAEQEELTLNLANRKKAIVKDQFKYLKVSFSIPDLYDSKGLIVAYKIEGLQNKWIKLENGQREISLNGLPAKKYQLQLRYSINNLEWTSFESELQLIVLPPWYKTTWFRLVITALIICLIIFAYLWRTKTIRRRNQVLKEQVAIRTKELSESNLQLVERIDESTAQNEELEQLNTIYKKQSQTILQQQNKILSQNSDFNYVLNQAGIQLDQLPVKTADNLPADSSTYPTNKIAILGGQLSSPIEETISGNYILEYCTSSQDILDFLPDFILLSDNDFVKIDHQITHLPIIQLLPPDGILKHPEIISDILIDAKNLEQDFRAKITEYIQRKTILKAQFTSGKKKPIDEQTVNPIDKKFLDTCTNFIEENLLNPLLNSDLMGKQLGLSRTVLYGKIKDLTGLGVHEFIRFIRIQKSLDLLKQKSENISQIAYAVGFSSPSYYIRCFTKQLGKSPKEYRDSEF